MLEMMKLAAQMRLENDALTEKKLTEDTKRAESLN